MTSTGELNTGIELLERAKGYGPRKAIVSGGTSYSYADLLRASEAVAWRLLENSRDLEERRVAFQIPASFEYAAVQWGIWRAGGIGVPLSVGAKEPELEHVLFDAGVSSVLLTEDSWDGIGPLCTRLGISLVSIEKALSSDPPRKPLPEFSPGRRAMMLYTSGTTNKPKGVVSTHANIEAQITSLVEAWGWRPDDRIPLFLPLHHIHGIVNVLSCALWSGAQVEAFPAFDMERILSRVGEHAYTVFMAVPTIYVKLIQALESAAPGDRKKWAEGFGEMRLMISGSAALPAAIHQKWTELTGQKLLERYGMTEIGMGISNPLMGERRPGAVGQPLPGVDLRLVGESGEAVREEGEPGEIQIRGPAVFTEYWQLPQVTAESFQDGWFRTGDMAVLEKGYYRILGRLSVDIIKSGGYKLSALEIEDVLRQHPLIQECAVVGIEDETWGEAVAAAVTTPAGEELSLDELRDWAAEHLSDYKIPKHLTAVEDFPRNAMGKVMKQEVKKLFGTG
ncbi:MAG: acyl-CoA synthetase [Longimicrobiales bacterium]|nr:acyl-CoA synthetase [Longimicrobiales bacterium]